MRIFERDRWQTRGRIPCITMLWMMLLLGLSFPAASQQQGVTARALMDTTEIKIGDQVDLRLEFTVPEGSQAGWALRGDTVTRSVEIIRRWGIDTVKGTDGWLTLRERLRVTSFDTGLLVIPPLRFGYYMPGDTLPVIAETEPILVHVSPLPADTTQPIRDIKGIQKAPFSLLEILPWMLLLLLISGLGALLYLYIQYRRGKRGYFLIPPKPVLPPHEQALEALEALRRKQLWQNGQYKEYYSELTDILRIYLDGGLAIDAPEMVTDEILEALRQKDIERKLLLALEPMLRTADLVKFARMEPLPDENTLSLELCIDFVRATRPSPAKEEGTRSQGETTDKPQKPQP